MLRLVAGLILLIAAASDAVADGASFKLDGLKVTSVGPTGPPALRVDLVILGEGYVQEDFAPRGRWEIDTAQLVANFFEKLPFKTERALFNVHLVEVVSLDRGADDRPDQDVKRTPFDCCYGNNGVQRLLVARDQKAVARAARNAPGADVIVVLVNDPRAGGSGGKTDDGVPDPVCSREATAFLTAIHELGHSLAGLGDEYADPTAAPNYPMPASGDLPYPNLTLAKLVDASTRESLVKTLKWGRFFRSPGAFSDLGKGFFEGGYYREKEVYRPAASCIMQTETGGGKFCYVCLDEMTRAIFRTCKRGPTGALPAAPVPDMEGALAAAHALYVEARFGKVLPELKKVEGKAGAAQEDLDAAKKLRKGIEESLSAGFEVVDSLLRGGDRKAAREYLVFVEAAFKGTEWAKEADAKKKEAQGR